MGVFLKMSNLLLFGIFLGMTLTHIVNGFYWSAIPTGLVMLLFVPGLILGSK
jgi:hypothetical protein